MSSQDLYQGRFAQLVGYRVSAWRDDHAEVSLEIREEHLNRSGVLHGGVMTTLIDSACGYCGCYSPDPARPRRAMTVSLTCHFLGPVREGDRLIAEARRTGGGRQIFFCDCKVVNQEGRLVAEGSGVFKYRRGSERKSP